MNMMVGGYVMVVGVSIHYGKMQKNVVKKDFQGIQINQNKQTKEPQINGFKRKEKNDHRTKSKIFRANT